MTDSTLSTFTPLERIDDKVGRARGLVRLAMEAIPSDRNEVQSRLFEALDYGLMAIEDLLDDIYRDLQEAIRAQPGQTRQ